MVGRVRFRPFGSRVGHRFCLAADEERIQSGTTAVEGVGQEVSIGRVDLTHRGSHEASQLERGHARGDSASVPSV
jgi:hypothetical protein